DHLLRCTFCHGFLFAMGFYFWVGRGELQQRAPGRLRAAGGQGRAGSCRSPSRGRHYKMRRSLVRPFPLSPSRRGAFPWLRGRGAGSLHLLHAVLAWAGGPIPTAGSLQEAPCPWLRAPRSPSPRGELPAQQDRPAPVIPAASQGSALVCKGRHREERCPGGVLRQGWRGAQ
uniref:Uncharacterized protein n=1 Tax=Anser brachyrhynchus TaxID=132585 RepID=A0A8B9BZY6_9AVES